MPLDKPPIDMTYVNCHHRVMRTGTILVALLLIAASPPPTAEDVGPQPAFADAVAATEQAMRARLIDPDSAQFEWPYRFTGGSLKALFSKRYNGWITCGLVNAKNRMGGYTGRVYFQVVIHNGLITMLDLGESQDIDVVAMSCQKLISTGFLQPALPAVEPPQAAVPPDPAKLMAAAQSGAAAASAQGGLGISFMPSPVGAILRSVAPGSKAEVIGLKAGETIAAINGISIKGMDKNTIIAILKAVMPVFTVSIVGVGDVKSANSHARDWPRG